MPRFKIGGGFFIQKKLEPKTINNKQRMFRR